jgi:ATP-dependent DNA ligase
MGFRCRAVRNGRLRAVSRRWWDMTPLLPELDGPPDGLAVDGELVALGSNGLPRLPRLCERMLHGRRRINVMLIVFDLLAIDGAGHDDVAVSLEMEQAVICLGGQ